MTAIGRPQRDNSTGDVTRFPKSVEGVASVAQQNRWSVRVPGPQIPGLVSTTTAFAGLLLLLTPFLWSGAVGGNWTSAGWNEAIVGAAIAVLGLVRLIYPMPLVVATSLGCLLGGWLALSPLFLDYGLDPASTPATIVDLLVGISVLIITVLGHADGCSNCAGVGRPAGGERRTGDHT
jgi:hypothetical protein